MVAVTVVNPLDITKVGVIQSVDKIAEMSHIKALSYIQSVGGPAMPSKLVTKEGQRAPTGATGSGVHVAAMPCPTVTDKGNTWIADAQRVANIALAWGLYIKETEILNMKMETANEYYRLAREMWDHFLSTYAPCEVNQVIEVSANAPDVKYDYDRGLYGQVADTVFAKAEAEFLRMTKQHCVCPSAGLVSGFNTALDTMRGDMVNFSMRASEAEAEVEKDVWWNRRMATLNMGRGLLSTAAAYSRMSVDARDEYQDIWRGVGSGAMTALAYFNSRNVAEAYEHYTPDVNNMGYGSDAKGNIIPLHNYMERTDVPDGAESSILGHNY